MASPPPAPGKMFKEARSAGLWGSFRRAPNPSHMETENLLNTCYMLVLRQRAHRTPCFRENITEAQRSQISGPWSPT